MESLDIIYLTDLFYPYLYGGGERQFYEIARRMAERHNVEVLTERIAGRPDREWLEGMEIRRVGVPHPMGRRSFLRNLLSIPISGISADVVHANQGAFALSIPLSHGARFLTIHDLYFQQWQQFHGPAMGMAGRMVEFLISKMPAHVIAVSNWTAEKLEVAGKKAAVIPNAIDTSKYRTGKKEKMVLYVGRLVNYKHVDELISAFIHSDLESMGYRLVIAGDGPQRSELKAMAKGHDISFEGFISEKKKIELLKKAEIFANPSEVEGFGIAVLEALASGCKVVAKPLPCYEFCNSNCLLTHQMEHGLVEMAGRKTVRADVSGYDWKNVVRKLEELYLSSLRR